MPIRKHLSEHLKACSLCKNIADDIARELTGDWPIGQTAEREPASGHMVDILLILGIRDVARYVEAAWDRKNLSMIVKLQTVPDFYRELEAPDQHMARLLDEYAKAAPEGGHIFIGGDTKEFEVVVVNIRQPAP